MTRGGSAPARPRRARTVPSARADGRTIDIDQATADALRAHLGAQAFQRRRDDYRHDLDLVFAHPDGMAFDPDVVRRRFGRLVTECPDVQMIRLHDCRHTCATLLLEEGESEKAVAERLGDTVEMVNETYAHVTAKMRRRAASTMAGILDGRRALRAQDVPSGGAQ